MNLRKNFKSKIALFFLRNQSFILKKSQKISDKTGAILWAILTCFLVSVMISIVRYLSYDLHVFQIIMMRNFFALLFFFPYIIKSGSGIFRTKKLHLHIIRGIVGLAGMLTWFYTITLIKLPEAVSITFITPLITTLAAVIFLKEKVERKNWIALFAGLVGVLVIVHPGFQEFKFAYSMALITACLWALAAIFVKIMIRTERPETSVVYMCFIIFFLSVPIAAPYLKAMNIHDLFWLAILALVSTLSHFSTSVAYRKADISVIQPFDFSRLIFTSFIAYFAFGELVDIWTVIGSIIILSSSIYFVPKKKGRLAVRVRKIFRRKSYTISNF